MLCVRIRFAIRQLPASVAREKTAATVGLRFSTYPLTYPL
jgi:hypothetical protein